MVDPWAKSKVTELKRVSREPAQLQHSVQDMCQDGCSNPGLFDTPLPPWTLSLSPPPGQAGILEGVGLLGQVSKFFFFF